MSIPTTNPIKIPRTATPIAIPANCPEEKARYELDEQLLHKTTYATQLIKIKWCDKEGCNIYTQVKKHQTKTSPKIISVSSKQMQIRLLIRLQWPQQRCQLSIQRLINREKKKGQNSVNLIKKLHLGERRGLNTRRYEIM